MQNKSHTLFLYNYGLEWKLTHDQVMTMRHSDEIRGQLQQKPVISQKSKSLVKKGGEELYLRQCFEIQKKEEKIEKMRKQQEEKREQEFLNSTITKKSLNNTSINRNTDQEFHKFLQDTQTWQKNKRDKLIQQRLDQISEISRTAPFKPQIPHKNINESTAFTDILFRMDKSENQKHRRINSARYERDSQYQFRPLINPPMPKRKEKVQVIEISQAINQDINVILSKYFKGSS